MALVSALAFASVIAGCATPSPQRVAAAALPDSCSPAGRDSFSTLTPDEALAPAAKGRRVCWGGGVQSVEAGPDGGYCLRLLHAPVAADGSLRWGREARAFIACGPATLERDMLAPFTQVVLSGRISAAQRMGGEAVPVIAIDSLYRLSDCLQGNPSPSCFHGFLPPRTR